MPTIDERFRVQLDLGQQALTTLDEIVELDGASTRAATVRKALRVLQWLLEHDRAGSEVVIRSKDGKETVLKLAL